MIFENGKKIRRSEKPCPKKTKLIEEIINGLQDKTVEAPIGSNRTRKRSPRVRPSHVRGHGKNRHANKHPKRKV